MAGAMGVGVFLATIDILKDMSDDFGEIYLQAMKLYQTCDTLRTVCKVCNMPSDLVQWKAANRARRAATLEARAEVLKHRVHRPEHEDDLHPNSHPEEAQEPQFLSDSIPIF